MSRRHHEEPGFGSDSFLDVLANMVGILIILIVVAGLRIDRGPVLKAIELPYVEPTESIAMIPIPPEPEPEKEPEEVEVEEPPLPPLGPDSPPTAIVQELRKIELDLDRLKDEALSNEAELSKRSAAADAVAQEMSEREQSLVALHKEWQTEKTRVSRLQQSLGQRQEMLSGLLAEFEEVRNAKPAAIEVKHRLTPVSQDVGGEEIHFRLKDNRITVIPLEQLVDRVKTQIERQKEWLSRHSRTQGSVGPIDGYTLNYVVERQALSPMEERKMGYGAFRVGVPFWEAVPDPNLKGETAEEALRRGSKFAIALQSASERSSLTFWTYPDSFKLFRQLQEAAHAEGFIVAARPMPEGLPIAGSPNGTRSAGQ